VYFVHTVTKKVPVSLCVFFSCAFTILDCVGIAVVSPGFRRNKAFAVLC
jgi:hypothetical protein